MNKDLERYKDKENRLKYKREWNKNNRKLHPEIKQKENEKTTKLKKKHKWMAIQFFKPSACALHKYYFKCELTATKETMACFEFHHQLEEDGKRHKKYSIGYILGRKWETIEKELKKCILLCSNCHHLLHAESDWKDPTILPDGSIIWHGEGPVTNGGVLKPK